jgi:hypothetical protein
MSRPLFEASHRLTVTFSQHIRPCAGSAGSASSISRRLFRPWWRRLFARTSFDLLRHARFVMSAVTDEHGTRRPPYTRTSVSDSRQPCPWVKKSLTFPSRVVSANRSRFPQRWFFIAIWRLSGRTAAQRDYAQAESAHAEAPLPPLLESGPNPRCQDPLRARPV